MSLALGRLPELEEVPTHAVAALAANRVAWSSALELLREELKDDETFTHCHENST